MGDYNCTWSPDGTKLAFARDFGNNGEVFMRNSNGIGPLIDLTNTAGQFDGNPDWAPDARPECPDSTVTTTRRRRPSPSLRSASTPGPLYERTDPTRGTRTPTRPTGRSAEARPRAEGTPFTYTPNPGFVGTDSFQIQGGRRLRLRQGVADRGTVTITVKRKPTPGGGEVFDGTGRQRHHQRHARP